MYGLLDYGSDSDSKDGLSDQQLHSFLPAIRNTDSVSRREDGINLLNSYCDSSDDDIKNPSSKRRRANIKDTIPEPSEEVHEGYQSTENQSACHLSLYLPPPPIIDSNSIQHNTTVYSPYTSLILFDNDYLSEEIIKYHKNLLPPSSSQSMTLKMEKQLHLEKKLDTLYNNFYGDTDRDNPSRKQQSFANHLKQQREFQNPAMFQSIIQEFDIDPVGTNIPPDLWNPRVDFSSNDFYDVVSRKEEENRIRFYTSDHA